MDELIGFDGLVFLDDAENAVIRGDAGSNIIIGEAGDDLLVGKDGNDLIIGGGFSDGDTVNIDLFNGVQTFAPLDIDGPDADGQDTILGGAGDDTIVGGSFSDGVDTDDGIVQASETRTATDDAFIAIFPHPYANEIWAGAGNDIVFAADFGDTIGGGAGDDQIFGGAGADLLFGGAGNDLVEGGAGNDRIYGSAGSDGIYGGEGEDIFYFAAGHGIDYIHDFSVADDTLNLAGVSASFTSAADVAAAAMTSFGPADQPGVLITTGEGDTLFLEDITIEQLADITYVF